MKFSIKNFFSKCDQFVQIWSRLLKKSLMENFIFCALLLFSQLHSMPFYLDCQPMKKLYYLQYQYMPFFVTSMAVLLYMPYVLFRIINTDMVSLRTTLGKRDVSSHLHGIGLNFTL